MEKRSRSLLLYILHPGQWFYIWLHGYTEYTVFLCGWWQWWGSRVEMGFSCPCLSLTLAQQWVKKLHRGTRGQPVYLPHSRASLIPPSRAIICLACIKMMTLHTLQCPHVHILVCFNHALCWSVLLFSPHWNIKYAVDCWEIWCRQSCFPEVES